MRIALHRTVPLLLALAAPSCDFQPDPEEGPSALPVARYATVRVQYRQPATCSNSTANGCNELVWFFGSWMKPGDEVALVEGPGRVWTAEVPNVPVNWPPSDEPHLVRVFDPRLLETPTGGGTAARMIVGGEPLYYLDQPGTREEAGFIYIDDNGGGRSPY
jgi:hypothetical protein